MRHLINLPSIRLKIDSLRSRLLKIIHLVVAYWRTHVLKVIRLTVNYLHTTLLPIIRSKIAHLRPTLAQAMHKKVVFYATLALISFITVGIFLQTDFQRSDSQRDIWQEGELAIKLKKTENENTQLISQIESLRKSIKITQEIIKVNQAEREALSQRIDRLQKEQKKFVEEISSQREKIKQISIEANP